MNPHPAPVSRILKRRIVADRPPLTRIEWIGLISSILTICGAAFAFYRDKIFSQNVPFWTLPLTFGTSLLIILLIYRLFVTQRSGVRIVPSDSTSVTNFFLNEDLLDRSNIITSVLFTAETIIGNLRQYLLSRTTPLSIRMIVRRPERTDGKRQIAEGCIATAVEISSKNSNIRIDIRFYNSEPYVRAYTFTGEHLNTCLLGMYRYDHNHPARFIGAEDNSMLYLDAKIDNHSLFVPAVNSRITRMWESLSSIRSCMFDFDGVLADTMELHSRSWHSGLERVSISCDYELVRRDIYILEGAKSEFLADFLVRKYSGKAPHDDVLSDLMSFRMKEFMNGIDDVKAFSGSARLLHEIRAWGVPIALVTGSPADIVLKFLHKSEIGNFDVIVTGDEISNGKPHPEPYLVALRRLGVPPTPLSVVVENAPLGVRSAKAAGVTVFGLLQKSPLEADALNEAGAHRVATDPSEIGRLLREMSLTDAIPIGDPRRMS